MGPVSESTVVAHIVDAHTTIIVQHQKRKIRKKNRKLFGRIVEVRIIILLIVSAILDIRYAASPAITNSSFNQRLTVILVVITC